MKLFSFSFCSVVYPTARRLTGTTATRRLHHFLELMGLGRIMAFMVLFSQVQPEGLLREDAGLKDWEVFYSTTCFCIRVQGG